MDPITALKARIMHSLEVLVARNALPTTTNDNAEGWSVQDLGSGQIRVEGPGRLWIVNASNPLLDAGLVHFHRTFPGPSSIAAQVEGIASQWRRIVSASGLWADCKAESLVA